MITQMKKYTFLVFHRDYEPFLEQLRELGVVHITQKAAGLIEDDEQLQAALQHEDELRRLLKQGAPDQLIAERNRSNNVSQMPKKPLNKLPYGVISMQHVSALKEAGYTLHFFECPTKAFEGRVGYKSLRKRG